MLSSKLGLKHILPQIKGKRVLMRVDFNVKIKEGKIKDLTRITSTIPSIKAILDNGAKSLVMMSHLGRPDGHVVPSDSMKPIVPVLEELLKKKVTFVNDCVGPTVEEACKDPKEGSIMLLENLRFHPEEEGQKVTNGKKEKSSKEDIAKFRKSLTKLGDIYVNDAFGTCHRAHSSMVGVNLPLKVAGDLLFKELESFARIMESPSQPFIVIMGGAKVADKIKVIMKMLDKVNEMIIGGGMAFTFKKVLENMEIGDSLFDPEGAKIVPDIMKKAKEKNVKMHFPVDFLIGNKMDSTSMVNLVSEKEKIPKGSKMLDHGPITIENFGKVIQNAKTILWNGPQGFFESGLFASGSYGILNDMIEATKKGAITVAGGGETVALIEGKKGSSEKLTHVSTGGGASLELLEGIELPGIASLSNK